MTTVEELEAGCARTRPGAHARRAVAGGGDLLVVPPPFRAPFPSLAARVSAVACVIILGACSETPREQTPEGAPYGAPCARNADCTSTMCVIDADPFCTRECFDDCTCPADVACVAIREGLSVCAPGENTCVGPEDAGAPPGDGGPPPEDAGAPLADSGVGGGAGAPCTSSADCADVTSVGGTGAQPEVTTVPQECWAEEDTGFPGGLCTMADCVENFRRDPCPAGTACIGLTRGSVCLSVCGGQSDCREGWTCRDDVDAPGFAHEDVCWFSCDVTGCGAGLTCQPDGTCEEAVEPPGPLDGCTDWGAGWSCTDLSPNLCSCSCHDWPHAGEAPMVECELTGVNEVFCTCATGGFDRESVSVQVAAGGVDCGQAETVFEDSFCGLLP